MKKFLYVQFAVILLTFACVFSTASADTVVDNSNKLDGEVFNVFNMDPTVSEQELESDLNISSHVQFDFTSSDEVTLKVSSKVYVGTYTLADEVLIVEFEDDGEAQMSIQFENFKQHERNESLYTAIVYDIENDSGEMQELMRDIPLGMLLGFYKVDKDMKINLNEEIFNVFHMNATVSSEELESELITSSSVQFNFTSSDEVILKTGNSEYEGTYTFEDEVLFVEFEDDDTSRMSIEFEDFNQHEVNESLYTAIVSNIENDSGEMPEFMQYITINSYLGFHNIDE